MAVSLELALLVSTVFMVGLGLSVATGVRVGQMTGAGRPRDASIAGWTGFLVAAVLMGVIAGAVLLGRDVIAPVYTDDAALAARAAGVMAVAAFIFVPDTLQVVMGQAVRAHFESAPGMIRVAPNRAEVFAVKLGFRIGDQTGFAGLDFVVPLATLAAVKDDLTETATTDSTVLQTWEQSMRDQVLGLPLDTDCVIDLGSYSVGELSRLQQGEMLELPPDAMNAIELRVPTAGGEVAFARGRLGANGRHKAVRLVEDPSEEFLDPLRQISD